MGRYEGRRIDAIITAYQASLEFLVGDLGDPIAVSLSARLA